MYNRRYIDINPNNKRSDHDYNLLSPTTSRGAW